MLGGCQNANIRPWLILQCQDDRSHLDGFWASANYTKYLLFKVDHKNQKIIVSCYFFETMQREFMTTDRVFESTGVPHLEMVRLTGDELPI